MADISNLSAYLKDIADAIREKNGKDGVIPAEDFDKEILAIESGGETLPVISDKSYIPAEDAIELEDAIFKNCNVASIADSVEYARWLGLATKILTPKPIEGYTVEYKNGSLKNTVTDTQKATINGNYITQDETLIMNGARIVTDTIGTPYGSFELYCAVNSNFSPSNSGNWYDKSCIFGCELPYAQKDFGLVIDNSGKAGLGYNTSSYTASSKMVKDGQFHHYVVVNTSSNMKLYIDGELSVNLNYTLNGNSPSTYGIFWNNSGTGTIVRGEFKTFRFYLKALTAEEVQHNYSIYQEA